MAIDDDPGKGLEAFWAAQPEVRPLILSHAQRRIESEIYILSSLQQRLSQISALMFAGAAVSATAVTSASHVVAAVKLLGAGATCSFALGGVISLIGLVSGLSKFPGDRPSWWGREGLDVLAGLSRTDAEYWLAGHYEAAILNTAAVSSHRAKVLNASVVLGGAAAVLIAGAGVVAATLTS